MAGAVPSHHHDVKVRTWLPDPSHYPAQLTPLSADVWFRAIGQGLHQAMQELRGPFGGFRERTELGWAYEGELAPEWDVDVEHFEAAALALPERWDRELKPAVHAITDALHGMRPESDDPEGAVEMLREMWRLVAEQWRLHFLVVIPAQVAIELLEQAYADVVGDAADVFALYRFLDTVENETNEGDRQLWDLAQLAKELRVDDVLREFPSAPAIERLRQLRDGRRFLQRLDDYLARFGGRSRWHELSLPREAEQPSMTMDSLRLLLDVDVAPGRHAPGRPVEVPVDDPGLRPFVRAGQVGYALKESHVHHIDYPGLLATREVLLGFARRLLAAGTIETPADIWMLRLDEIEALLTDPRSIDLDTVVAQRREELAQGQREGPKQYLGQPPVDVDRHAALEKFYGSPRTGDGRGLLRGIAASPGAGEGIARVVHDVDDFGRIERGDVLVATTTTPAWTPLFPSLAALVTETGGVLCHAAIVAREYGIPAVVGVDGATTTIADGVRVKVDGATGDVTLL